MSNVYLEHHGIKGQRWGVRRYQNEDGSLTSAGRRRASIVSTNKTPYERKKEEYANRHGINPNLDPASKKRKENLKKRPDVMNDGYEKRKTPDEINKDLLNKAEIVSSKVKEKIAKSGDTEVAKRGKSAIDVLLNGDSDWMGNKTYSDDTVTELKNRGKAALERLMYSQEQIDNKKFFGRPDF